MRAAATGAMTRAILARYLLRMRDRHFSSFSCVSARAARTCACYADVQLSSPMSRVALVAMPRGDLRYAGFILKADDMNSATLRDGRDY